MEKGKGSQLNWVSPMSAGSKSRAKYFKVRPKGRFTLTHFHALQSYENI